MHFRDWSIVVMNPSLGGCRNNNESMPPQERLFNRLKLKRIKNTKDVQSGVRTSVREVHFDPSWISSGYKPSPDPGGFIRFLHPRIETETKGFLKISVRSLWFEASLDLVSICLWSCTNGVWPYKHNSKIFSSTSVGENNTKASLWVSGCFRKAANCKLQGKKRQENIRVTL